MQHAGEDDVFIPLGQVTPGYLSCRLEHPICRVLQSLSSTVYLENFLKKYCMMTLIFALYAVMTMVI